MHRTFKSFNAPAQHLHRLGELLFSLSKSSNVRRLDVTGVQTRASGYSLLRLPGAGDGLLETQQPPQAEQPPVAEKLIIRSLERPIY